MTAIRGNESLSTSPLTGSWRVVPTRSEIGFATRMFGLVPVRGRYSGYEGELHLDDGGYASGVLRFHTETIGTGMRKLDAHLRSEDFFHVSVHPHASFDLTSLIPAVSQRSGDLEHARTIGTE